MTEIRQVARLGELEPGDVIAVNTGAFWGRIIRLGGLLHGDGSTDHVVIVHHIDADGTRWGIEGRPGGVGWVDLTTCTYRIVSSNLDQPKTDADRQFIANTVEGALKMPYDWTAIVADAMQAIGAPLLWPSSGWGPKSPGHIVCSSLAQWAYVRRDLPHPHGDRWCTPWDWDRFNREKRWAR